MFREKPYMPMMVEPKTETEPPRFRFSRFPSKPEPKPEEFKPLPPADPKVPLVCGLQDEKMVKPFTITAKLIRIRRPFDLNDFIVDTTVSCIRQQTQNGRVGIENRKHLAAGLQNGGIQIEPNGYILVDPESIYKSK